MLPSLQERVSVAEVREAASKPSAKTPEFAFQLAWLKLHAKGTEAVRPAVWSVSTAILLLAGCFAVSRFF